MSEFEKRHVPIQWDSPGLDVDTVKYIMASPASMHRFHEWCHAEPPPCKSEMGLVDESDTDVWHSEVPNILDWFSFARFQIAVNEDDTIVSSPRPSTGRASELLVLLFRVLDKWPDSKQLLFPAARQRGSKLPAWPQIHQATLFVYSRRCQIAGDAVCDHWVQRVLQRALLLMSPEHAAYWKTMMPASVQVSLTHRARGVHRIPRDLQDVLF